MVGEEIAALAQEDHLLLSEATWLEADVGPLSHLSARHADEYACHLLDRAETMWKRPQPVI